MNCNPSSERVNALLARARSKGIRLGRHPVKASVEERILSLRKDGMGILKIGRTVGVGTSPTGFRGITAAGFTVTPLAFSAPYL
jgi:DNA invertase Pin-like site-specific DNA recombinase